MSESVGPRARADGSAENFSPATFAQSTMIGSSLLSGRRTCASLEKLRGKSFQESHRRARARPKTTKAHESARADGSPENFSSTSFAESTTIGSSLLSGRRSCASLEKLRGKSFQESRRQARARPRRARHDFVKKCRHMGREFQVMTSCLTLFLTLFLRKRPGKVKSAAPSMVSAEPAAPSADS